MDYEHFLKQVAEDLRYSIPGATVEMSDVVKVQGESYQGIAVRMNDSPIAASMNLRFAAGKVLAEATYSILWRKQVRASGGCLGSRRR